MKLSVGPKSGDLQGKDDKVLQAALDYLDRLGGGILQIFPGEYTLHNVLYLHSNLEIEGAGEATVLKKAPSITSPFARLTEWYETQVQVEDPSGFFPGCGVMLQWGPQKHPNRAHPQHTVLEVDGDILTLDCESISGIGPENDASVITLFPLITGRNVHNVRVKDLVLEGNKEQNDYIDGNFAGGVFLTHCTHFTFDKVISRNYNGDGFSFQVCNDIHFEDCRAENNANFGFHPGSGAQRPIFRRCVARGNNRGIFFCRGVNFGLVEDCDFSANRDAGIWIGDRDTDNRISNCTIEDNRQAGIVCTDRENSFRGAHRSILEKNLVRDNGWGADGVGIDIRGGTFDVEIRGNTFQDSGSGKQRIGIRLSAAAENARLEANSCEGMETDCLEEVEKSETVPANAK